MEEVYLYPISVEVCEEGGYYVECSVLQGCHAEGETYAEAIKNIQDVIKVHIQCRKEHGEFVSSVGLKTKKGFHIDFPVPVFA